MDFRNVIYRPKSEDCGLLQSELSKRAVQGPASVITIVYVRVP
jgi:hypothetical protein